MEFADDKRKVAWNLRRTMTTTEHVLWERLRADRVFGFHFRRQEIIGGFIVDFCCLKAHLVVEVDGSIHERLVESDACRETVLRSLGFRVLRFTNAEVVDNTDEVIARIAAALVP